MDQNELKQVLIKELGSMPFKDKKQLKDESGIPEILLEKLIRKIRRRRKFAQIMIPIGFGLLMISLLFNYLLKEDGFSVLLLGIIVLIQIPLLIFNPDFKDSSKKEFILRLLKKLN